MERDFYQNKFKKIKKFIEVNGWRKISIYIFIFSVIIGFTCHLISREFFYDCREYNRYSDCLKMRITYYASYFFLYLAIFSVILNLFSKSKKTK